MGFRSSDYINAILIIINYAIISIYVIIDMKISHLTDMGSIYNAMYYITITNTLQISILLLLIPPNSM